MTKVLGISGSLRRGSYNSALLRAAARLMPEDSTLDIASLRGIPLYDGDVEAQGIPASVSQLKEAIIAADGVLLVTPEYNNSIPGVFKNAIDWLSRPSSDIKRVFGGRRHAANSARRTLDSCRARYAPKMKRLPVYERMNLSGISARRMSMNTSPVQCIGITWSGLISFNAATVSRTYSSLCGARCKPPSTACTVFTPEISIARLTVFTTPR